MNLIKLNFKSDQDEQKAFYVNAEFIESFHADNQNKWTRINMSSGDNRVVIQSIDEIKRLLGEKF